MITKEKKLFKYAAMQIMSILLILSVSIGINISAKAAEPHITILGTEVTSANASDILGDGHFSYNVDSNKLVINGEIAIPDRKRILIENTKDLTIAFGTNTKITSEDAWPIRICGSTGVTVTGKNVTIRVEKNVYPAAVSILGSEVTFKYTEMDILVVSSSSEVGSGIKTDCSHLAFEGANMSLTCTDSNGNGLGYPIFALDGNAGGYTPYCKPSQVTFELCGLTDGNKWVMIAGNVLNENDKLVSECTIEDKRALIGNASVTISDQTYTGKALTPVTTVTLDGKTLVKDKDYTVTYSNNINVGTATVTITGCGAYTGTIQKTFKILSAPQPTTSESPYNASDIAPEKPARLEDVEKVIIATKNENDQKGSTFSLLQAKGVPKSKSSIKLSWKGIKGAAKYVIYGNKCGKSNVFKKIKEVSGTSYTQKKLKKGTYYKYLVVAVSGDKALAVSKTIHVATKGGKVGNNTGVKLNKTKLSLKKGESQTLKATLKTGNLKVKIHRKVAWASSNVSVAKVNKKGKITGVKKGTCYVYAYAQNGVFAKVKVTIE